MFEYKVRPSKYRFLAPLLISVVAAVLFSIVALCARFPAVEDCLPESMRYLSWFFLIMFLFGILLSAYRAYKDFYKSNIRVLRLHH